MPWFSTAFTTGDKQQACGLVGYCKQLSRSARLIRRTNPEEGNALAPADREEYDAVASEPLYGSARPLARTRAGMFARGR